MAFLGDEDHQEQATQYDVRDDFWLDDVPQRPRNIQMFLSIKLQKIKKKTYEGLGLLYVVKTSIINIQNIIINIFLGFTYN